MHPAIKILIGALMIVVGVYSTVTFWEQVLFALKAGIGPLLVLIGAFIVWLESDEWKMMREQQKDSGLQQQFEPSKEIESVRQQQETTDTEILEQNVDQVKQSVRERTDIDYEALLEAEKKDKDRKTVKEFLERRI